MLFDHLSSLLLGIAAVVSGALLVKTLFVLYAMPSAHGGSGDNFAYKLGQHPGDPLLIAYSQELGYRLLINDPSLSTGQWKALLTLPDRVRAIARFLKTRSLLPVHETEPVIRRRLRRHESKLYRQLMLSFLAVLYVAFSVLALPSLLTPPQALANPVIDAIFNMPLPVSLYYLFLAAVFIFNAVKLRAASVLVKAASVSLKAASAPLPFRQ